MTEKPDSPAARRNQAAILDVISAEFPDRASILEIGSGTGQHAVFFGRELPGLTWQTSDRVSNHAGIRAWLQEADLDNVRAPIVLDVQELPKFDEKFDGVFSANTAHIMNLDEVEQMFRVVADCLAGNGKFCLYGPFNQDGKFTSDSNRNFDASLKRQNPLMGIRDLHDLDSFAEANALRRNRLYAMPANNMIAVWTSK
jgi:cyclopropane fatty-acyl-phospholipid synthase-like methyltransferase